VRVTNTKSSKYFILLASQTHTKKNRESTPLAAPVVSCTRAEISFGQKGYPKKKFWQSGRKCAETRKGKPNICSNKIISTEYPNEYSKSKVTFMLMWVQWHVEEEASGTSASLSVYAAVRRGSHNEALPSLLLIGNDTIQRARVRRVCSAGPPFDHHRYGHSTGSRCAYLSGLQRREDERHSG
jgi:hypothetical protein